MSQKQKAKSPSAPSYALSSSFDDAGKLYGNFSHGSFARTEIASTLGLSATSSSVGGRVFALTEYGLINGTGDSYQVAQTFHALENGPRNESAFKKTAVQAIQRSGVLAELMNEFSGKLPDEAVIVQRLESQKKFNKEKAKKTASVLKASLQFAGVLDANNNILPTRDDSPSGGEDDEGRTPPPDPRDGNTGSLHKTEVPLAEDRIVVVAYPHDLITEEATKVGKVLSALVG